MWEFSEVCSHAREFNVGSIPPRLCEALIILILEETGLDDLENGTDDAV